MKASELARVLIEAIAKEGDAEIVCSNGRALLGVTRQDLSPDESLLTLVSQDEADEEIVIHAHAKAHK